MIRPDEINRLRDLRSADTDAHIDLCRPRVLVLAKAVEQTIPPSAATDVIAYGFSDGSGGSGLVRGDIIRGEVWGYWAVDSGGMDRGFTFQILTAGTTFAYISALLPDTVGDPCAFTLTYFLRIRGGETSTLNSPLKSSTAGVYAGIHLTLGDRQFDPTTTSSQVIVPAYITTSAPVTGSVNLAAPLSIKLQAEHEVDSTLVIYGGYMEGL
jgi:hypothetical protein